MFHKRNPQTPFPAAFPGTLTNGDAGGQGGTPASGFAVETGAGPVPGAPAQAQQTASPAPAAQPAAMPRPAGVREYGYSRASGPQGYQGYQAQGGYQTQGYPTSTQAFTPPVHNSGHAGTSSPSNTPNNTNKSEGQTMSNPNENTSGQANSPAARPLDIPGTMPYGRPMAPGAIGGYGAASHTAAYNPYGSGRKLIIGEGITMSGEIEHCDHLIVEGTVQATLKDAKLLDISEAGVFYGTVDIEEATIAGRFEGDISVNGRLTVKATGVITGSIRYKELAVEAGASIEGTLSPVGRKDENVAAADFSKGKAVAKQARDAQKAGEQLPFGEKGSAISAAQ